MDPIFDRSTRMTTSTDPLVPQGTAFATEMAGDSHE
ncbi:hypothetical protein CLV28_0233 [Sediminihabitans luteus]|uniref:Uncharacterized protein n=1 Tax=Sediminihabitans luteus TaxID=1138585 RepID=A0A2M9CYK4_9CELL|nr:hypothetical protein CLV28_0233 [Sediminihabitans luteus]